jgi:molybdenum cofactor cytidylyltransferase
VDVLAVLLAAGGGSRFRPDARGARARDVTHKLFADLDGRPVYRHALDHVLDAGFTTTVVVTGAVPLTLTDDDRRRGALVIHHPHWADGQATSLAAAIGEARTIGAEAVVVGLADQPFVPPSAWRAVADAPVDAPLVVAVYGDHDGDGDDGRRLGPNPVRIHRRLWDDLPTEGDEGARGLIRSHRSTVHEVSCAGSPADIDTLEDLERWTSS